MMDSIKEYFASLSLSQVLWIAGGVLLGILIIARMVWRIKTQSKQGKYPYKEMLTMEELVTRSKDLLGKHPELASVTFVHMTPKEVPAQHVDPARIPAQVKHVILAASVKDGKAERILAIMLCAGLEESVLASLPLEINR